MKLKVCGMKYQENIQKVAALRPDYLGFIFYEESSRYFNSEIPKISIDIKKVGVFVNSEIEYVETMIDKYQLNVIQLHGNESPTYCEALAEQNVEIIKVFSINDAFDFSLLDAYEKVCDFYLFDTKGKLPGGNGYAFDWEILNKYPSTKPYFLSGGIGLQDVQKLDNFKANKASKYCFAIDVNSKFEIEAGLKNIKKIEKFKHDLQH